MTWAVIIVRTLVGVAFLVPGLDYFLHFLPPMAMPASDTPAGAYLGLLVSSRYMTAIKVCELLGAVNLLSGRFAPLGIAILLPISLNVLFFEIFLLKQPGPGYAMVPMLLFVLVGYRHSVRHVFDGSARIG